MSIKELVATIEETISKHSKIVNTPKMVINLLVKVGDFLPLPINSKRVQKLVENYEVSNYKIKTAIKKELPLSSKKGIEKTIASF